MDLACGTGILTFRIARKFPHTHVIGVELRDEYLNIAKKKARSMGIGNVEFILSRAEEVPWDEPVDCITSSYLAKYADLARFTPHVKEMLCKGGILVSHEFTYPSFQPFAWIWELHFRLMQTAGTWKYPSWKTIFFQLPKLVRETRWVPELVTSLREHSFKDVSIEFLTFGISAIVTARK
jgi:demethylmenaquinone methyltransferase/2-methoxy-6-polyprenyl-1,4-benzoquinol methylase